MRVLKQLTVLCIMTAAGTTVAQNMKSFEFQVGSLNPKDTPAGVIWNAKYGISVDEAVDISFGASLFNKSYTKVTTVAEGAVSAGGVVSDTRQAELEYKTMLIPLTAGATIHLPVNRQFGFYAGAGLSWQFLINKENNYVDDISETRNYNGGGWVARVGGELYLGSKSSLIGEMVYNHCRVKGNKEKKEGLPVWDEVDVTGLGFMVGLRVLIY